MRVGGLVARLVALRRLSLGVASALERGESPDVAAALVKDLGTRFEGDVVHAARTLSPEATDAGAPEGSVAELLALGITHLPAYTLRGGTNEILRGIITKGLPDEEVRGLPAVPAADAPVAELVAYARAVGVDPDSGPPVEELAARSVLARAGLALPHGPLTLVVADSLDVRPAGEGRVRLDGTLARVPRGREATVVVVTEGPDGTLAAVLGPGTATRIAHQLHGAVGFTERSPLRLSTTRLWSWRDEDGDERAWAGRLGAAATGTDDLWALLTG